MKNIYLKNSGLINIFMEGSWGTQPCQGSLKINKQKMNSFFKFFFINVVKVKQLDKIRFLGVIIDDKLTWGAQIELLENKLISTIVLIKRIKKFIPSLHYIKIYHCLFLSHLTYGITCSGGAYTSKLQKLFNIQKKCIRMLFGEIYSFDHPEYYY